MKLKLQLVLLLIVLIMMSSHGLARELSVAVMPFKEAGYLKIDWSHKEQLLEGVAQMITDGLANQPNLRLVERARISEVVKEQQFQYSGMVDTSTAVELGRLIGADVLVVGTLNEFGWESQGGLSFGAFSIKKSTARVKLSARLIAVQTGQILASLEATGEDSGAALSVENLRGFSFGSSEFNDSVIGKALKAGVANLTGQFQLSLNDAELKLTGAPHGGTSGKVVAIKSSYVIVDVGSDDGISSKDNLAVYHLEEIPGLDEPVRIPTGVLHVISVDPHASVTEVKSSDGLSTIRVGDVVELSVQ